MKYVVQALQETILFHEWLITFEKFAKAKSGKLGNSVVTIVTSVQQFDLILIQEYL